ncbi:hypothetical protein E4K72_05520 [Oxalobacteraceae bacterium OM1]|nr:hypothetical protein E4K72_05520 [Oxalobacteraceae bacterium OM1]
MGPWLYPALRAYGIPDSDWTAIAHLFIDRLALIIQAAAQKYPVLHVVETRHILTAAAPGTRGPDHDWQNEIHPTRQGYHKLAEKYAAAFASADAPMVMSGAAVAVGERPMIQ